MGVQIPGIFGAVQPNVFSRVKTKERVNAVSGGSRVVCVIGEGETEEVIVQSARGYGSDGRNSDFSGFNAPDGRHFQISKLNLVPGRSRVLKNGIPLSVLEAPLSVDAFDSRYDVRLDPITGRFEMQSSYLEDYGTDVADGSSVRYFRASSLNTGNGAPLLTTESLVDSVAPAETWTVRCVSNIKDGYSVAIPTEATFTVTGTASGQLKDSNGNPYVWKSDGVPVSNGILSFSIAEGSTSFEVGDKFTLRVKSGVLSPGDNVVARYIAEEDLNAVETFFTAADVFAKHGQPSETNTLSLGAQMAFENGAPVVTAIQAKPPVPRKTSRYLINADNPLSEAVEGATGGFEISDTIFPLGIGDVPDFDSKINVFVVNSDGTEQQLLLNKEEFYSADLSDVATAYDDFVLGPTGSAYTVFSADEVEQSGSDGYIEVLDSNTIYFRSASILFEADRQDLGEGDVEKHIEIISPAGFAGTYVIDTIGDGYGNMKVCTATTDLTLSPGDVVESTALWQLVDPNDTGTYFAITDDVADTYLTAGKGLRISFVNTVDADFFDTNWGEALEAAELAEAQFIVPLPMQTVSNIFQATKVHVESMSNIMNQRERIGIFGAITGLTPNHLIGRTLAAVEDIGVLEGIQGDDPEEVLAGNVEDLADYSVRAAFGDSFRCIYLWPDQIVRNIAGQNTFLPGYFMAAALGGFLAGQTNIAEPATYRTLTGFNILRTRTARNITKNELGGVGVLVVEPIAGGGRMMHGLTTVSSGAPEEEEISIVGIRDQVARSVRASLRPFIGKIQSSTLISQLNQDIGKLMRSLVGQGLLAGVGSISVTRNQLEPRQIDISVLINPVGPVNWIFVDLTVSL